MHAVEELRVNKTRIKNINKWNTEQNIAVQLAYQKRIMINQDNTAKKLQTTPTRAHKSNKSKWKNYNEIEEEKSKGIVQTKYVKVKTANKYNR